jgi:hypothetical protein
MRVKQARQGGTSYRDLDTRWELFEGELLHGALQRWRMNVNWWMTRGRNVKLVMGDTCYLGDEKAQYAGREALR